MGADESSVDQNGIGGETSTAYEMNGAGRRAFLLTALLLTGTLILLSLGALGLLWTNQSDDRAQQIAAIETQNVIILATNEAVTQTLVAIGASRMGQEIALNPESTPESPSRGAGEGELSAGKAPGGDSTDPVTAAAGGEAGDAATVAESPAADSTTGDTDPTAPESGAEATGESGATAQAGADSPAATSESALPVVQGGATVTDEPYPGDEEGSEATTSGESTVVAVTPEAEATTAMAEETTDPATTATDAADTATTPMAAATDAPAIAGTPVVTSTLTVIIIGVTTEPAEADASPTSIAPASTAAVEEPTATATTTAAESTATAAPFGGGGDESGGGGPETPVGTSEAVGYPVSPTAVPASGYPSAETPTPIILEQPGQQTPPAGPVTETPVGGATPNQPGTPTATTAAATATVAVTATATEAPATETAMPTATATPTGGATTQPDPAQTATAQASATATFPVATSEATITATTTAAATVTIAATISPTATVVPPPTTLPQTGLDAWGVALVGLALILLVFAARRLRRA